MSRCREQRSWAPRRWPPRVSPQGQLHIWGRELLGSPWCWVFTKSQGESARHLVIQGNWLPLPGWGRVPLNCHKIGHLQEPKPGKVTLFAMSLPSDFSGTTPSRSRRYTLRRGVSFNTERLFCASPKDKVGWVGLTSSRELQINVAAEGHHAGCASHGLPLLRLQCSCCDAAYIFCKRFHFFLSLEYSEVTGHVSTSGAVSWRTRCMVSRQLGWRWVKWRMW